MAGFSIVMLVMAFMVIFFIISVVVMICEVVDYVFESIALMEMSKEKGVPAPGTAWIPIYQRYILGKVSGNTAMGITALITDSISLVAIILSFFWYGETLGNLLWLLASGAKIVSFIMVMVLSYQIFVQRKKKYATLYTVFSVLTGGFLRAIFLFVVRKGEKKEAEIVIEN